MMYGGFKSVVFHALIDKLISSQAAVIGEKRMAAIQHTKFHFFIGKHVRDEHRPCFIPVRTTGNEIIFDNPLTEILAYDAAGIGKTDLVFNHVKLLWRHCRHDAIDHGARKGDMLRYPGRQLRIEIIGKRNDRRFGQMTVFRNVIARQYTKRGKPLLAAYP